MARLGPTAFLPPDSAQDDKTINEASQGIGNAGALKAGATADDIDSRTWAPPGPAVEAPCATSCQDDGP